MERAKLPKFLAALLALALCLSLAVPVFAADSQPVTPLQFRGSVTIGGEPAPIPTTISAEIDGVPVASVATSVVGHYVIDVPYEGNLGKTVVFKVEGVGGGEHEYVNPWTTPIVTLDLRIGAAPPPNISVSPTSKNLGNVTVGSSSSPQTVTVSNAGTANLLVGTITVTGVNASQFTIQNDNCSRKTIALNGSATLQVVFSPTSTGAKSATLEIPSNDPDEATVTIPLSGNGIAVSDDGGGWVPPTYYTDTNLFGKAGSFPISSTGIVQTEIKATSVDGKLTLNIPVGTIAKDKNGNPLSSLTAVVNTSPPPPPAGANIIGLVYNFGPNGATFNPPLTLTWSYDPAALPTGIAEESLVIAYYDATTGKWVELDCVVDAANNKITASVSHFTTFAIIGTVKLLPVPVPAPSPAAFSLSNLTVQPAAVKPEEAVTITVSVANTGGTQGSYTVVLMINGAVEATKEVTVNAGFSKEVTFTTARDMAGSYSVTVDGLSGSFTVVPVVVSPAPAAFSLSNLSIKPLQVQPKKAVTIMVSVANTGGTEGSYTVVLKIDGVKKAERSVTIAAGGSKTITFSVTREEAASYTVDVDGLSGSFTVVAPAKTNWPLIGGIIVAVVIVALAIFFLVVRRRLRLAQP